MHTPHLRPHTRRLSYIGLALLIAACGSSPERRPVSSPSQFASALTPLEQVEEAIRNQDDASAERQLAQIDPSQLDEQDQLRYRVLQAELALLRDQPTEALQLLPPPWQTQNPQLAVWIEQARARVLFRLDDPVKAVGTLVEAERLLGSAQTQEANRELIWNGLANAHLDLGIYSRLGEADPVTAGWIELAMISRSVWLEAGARAATISDWRQRYTGHPGQFWLARINEERRQALAEFRTVALLLPLQGAIASAAESVRDGFMAAWYGSGEQRPDVRIYDSGETTDSLQSAYQRALDDGAEFIIGPLRKNDVSHLAAQEQPGVPILALNYLDDHETAPFNLFQWGLAPEDEARQAAERAITDHLRHAVALVPNNNWGDRVVDAFSRRLQELGGQVLEIQRYENSTRDYSTEIKALMNLDDSAARHATMRAMLGETPKFEPRRRADVDMIFVAARGQQARSIRPQLKFHRAGDLPIYATALVYDGQPEASRELDGIRFCDMPWMLENDGHWAPVRRQLEQQFADRHRAFPRLFVLGYDAYNLVRLIRSGQLQTGMYLPAASGNLNLHQDGVISRSLTCATLENGQPKVLDLNLFPELDTEWEDAPAAATEEVTEYDWPRR